MVVIGCSAAAVLVAGTAGGSGLAGQSPEPRTIEVLARRYSFEPAEIAVTAGEAVRLVVRSGDGLHGFEIKPLNISKEVPRGSAPVIIDFVAGEAGRFPIVCSVYCGEGHEDMNGVLVVQAREQDQPRAQPFMPSEPVAGRPVFLGALRARGTAMRRSQPVHVLERSRIAVP